MTRWHDDMMQWWHKWWHDDMMKWWHDNMMTRWLDDIIDDTMKWLTRWHDDIMKQWNSIIIQCNLRLSKNGRRPYGYATCSYDQYTKHNDENHSRFWWNIIIIQCNLPPPNYGRPLQPKLPPTHMTYIQSTTMKMTADFVEIASLSSVTYHCQIMVVMRIWIWHLLVWPMYQAQWWGLQ